MAIANDGCCVAFWFVGGAELGVAVGVVEAGSGVAVGCGVDVGCGVVVAFCGGQEVPVVGFQP